MYLSTEKCKKVILWVLLFFIFLFFAKKLSVLLFPLLASFLFAFSLQKPINSLESAFKIPRKLSSFILVLFFILIFLFTSFLILKKLQSELLSLLTVFPKLTFKEDFLSKYLSLFFEKALSLFSSVSEFLPKLLISVTVFIFSLFYISAEYNKGEKFFPVLNKVFTRVFWGYIKSYFILFLFTFAFLYFAFSLLKINFSFILSFVIAILDVFPILSAGLLILPFALFKFFSGYRSLALFLLFTALFLTLIKKFIEPKVLGGFVGLHPLISLIAISSGYLFMGVSGAFLFPLVLSIILELKKEM